MNLSDLKPGMIVVTEGGNGFIPRAVRWFTRSRWTHTFLVDTNGEGIEAWFPDGVRWFSLADRFDELAREHRDFVVLDYPGITVDERLTICETARKYLGRKYDVVQIVYFALFRRFIDDGPLRVICSRLETAIYKEALGWDLFTPASFARHGTAESRRWQLEQGWATPGEMLSDSILTPVQSSDSEDLHQDYEAHYDDLALYTHVSQELETMRAADPAISGSKSTPTAAI